MDMEVDGTNSSNGSGSNQARKRTEEMDTEPASNTDSNQPNMKGIPPPIIRRENDEIPTELGGTDIISYTANDHLGQGGTSTVYRGYYGKVRCAVKRVNSKYVEVYKNELAIWQDMKEITEDANVNIVTLFRWTEWKEGNGITYYFAMERALCDLEHRVQQLKEWRDAEDPQFESQMKKLPEFLYGAAKGLMWIHNSGILHRDIKPENVLIFETSKGEIAKLGDFGVSRKLSATSTGTDSAGRGTSDWMAPEAIQAKIFKKNFYNTKYIDIFSLGMTFHYATSLGSHPFGYSSQFGEFITMNIKDTSVLPTKLGYPHFEADHLFQWMMRKQAQQRPKIIEVCNHPFFWSWERKKEFLLAVAICFDPKKEEVLLRLRKEVDANYTTVMYSSPSLPPPDWEERLGGSLVDHFSKRKITTGRKRFVGTSIMSLVELIRDKFMHRKDMVDELTKSDKYFGENNSFSEKKYVEFFLNTFPELVIILFCALAGSKKEIVQDSENIRDRELIVLRNNFYAHFNTVPPVLPELNPTEEYEKVLRKIFSYLALGQFEECKHSLLKCRMVHPHWTIVMDKFLEEKCLDTWTNVELSKKICGDQQPYTFTMLKLVSPRIPQPESSWALLCPPRIHEKSRSTTLTTPFPSKSLVVKFVYGSGSPVFGKIHMKPARFWEFFVQRGVHLTSLVLYGIKASTETLQRIFERTSNLKALTLDSVSFNMDLITTRMDDHLKRRQCPRVFIHSSDQSCLPRLPKLEHVRIFQTSVKQRLLGVLIGTDGFYNLYDWILKPYKSQLVTLDVDSYIREMRVFDFPVLKRLSIWEGREVWLNTDSMIVPQLEVLCMGAFCKGIAKLDSRTMSLSAIKEYLARFSGTLKDLHLDFLRDEFQHSMLQYSSFLKDGWFPEKVVFLNLKTLSILYPKFPKELEALKDMLGAMPELETLNFLRFVDEGQEFINGDEEQAENQIEQERYWEACPKLKKISVRMEVDKESVFFTQYKGVTVKN